jgi:hypothetical protein
VPELQQAAPDGFAQIAEADAQRLGINDGDKVKISSRRGSVVASARVGDILEGHVFMPFHYGYWDEADQSDQRRAANELTVSEWCPVSKQPYFKCAAVKLQKVEDLGTTSKLADALSVAADQTKEMVDKVLAQAHIPRDRVADAIGLVEVSAHNFIASCAAVATHHFEDAELVHGMRELTQLCKDALERFEPFVDKYGEISPSELTRAASSSTPPIRAGAFGLLRDLQSLLVAASELHVLVISLAQAARALRDEQLLTACTISDEGCKRQIAWLNTQIEHRSATSITTKY